MGCVMARLVQAALVGRCGVPASRRLSLASQGGRCRAVPCAGRELAGSGWHTADCALWRSPSFGDYGSAGSALLFACVPFWVRRVALAERAVGFCRWYVFRPAFGEPGAACVALLSSCGAI